MTVQDLKRRVALITGVTGQDGAYLAELLLSKGYVVHGVKRRSSSFNTARIDHLYRDPHETESSVPPALRRHDRFDQPDPHHPGDAARRDLQSCRPEPCQVSFETPEYTANADAIGTLRLLEAIRILKLEKKTRFYQASTSELYGLVQEIPADARRRRFIRARPMASPSSTATGSR